MIITRIETSGFMSHAAKQCVEMPACGIVLVTGFNGAGKSALAEAVSTAIFGKTLRGATPWVTDAAGRVVVETDKVSATRSITKGGSKSLAWSMLGEQATNWETNTKAQQALEGVVGSFDVWRRVSVFSAQDLTHFTLASDSERKRLLESILDLQRFDSASDACRKELNAADKCVTKCANECAVHVERVEGEQRRKRDAQAALAAMPSHADVATLRKRHDALLATIKQANAEIVQAQAKLDYMIETLNVASSCTSAAQRALTLVQDGKCSQCSRPWEQATIDTARVAYADALAHENAVKSKSIVVIMRKAVDELREEQLAFVEQRNSCITAIQLAEQCERQRVQLQSVLDAVSTDVDTAEDELEELQIRHIHAKRNAAELAAVDRVLSLTGVRSQLLADSLAGIETIANSWLGRIAGWNMSVSLKPYSERANGTVRDAISLAIHGAGGGHGYAASSGGQRRRIDVALLFALAEISGAASNSQASTMFVDEALDSLDDGGVDAVCDVLQELATTRAIVLITHNAAFKQRLRYESIAKHLHVEAGVITELKV